MKKLLRIILLTALLSGGLIITSILVQSCEEDEKQIELQKNKSIEVVYQTEDLPHDLVLLTRTEKVYKMGVLVASFTCSDTIPGLSPVRKEIPGDDDENTVVTVQDKYQFFITIK